MFFCSAKSAATSPDSEDLSCDAAASCDVCIMQKKKIIKNKKIKNKKINTFYSFIFLICKTKIL